MKPKLTLILFLALVLGMFSQVWADVTIGSGTASNGNIPINTNYGYSYSQQIYTQAQIGSAGSIQRIAFKKMSGSITNSSSWTVYMGHTTKTSFTTTTDWIPLASLTQVFSGTVVFPTDANWYEIVLNTPFDYNNTDNLVVAVDENTSNYGSSIAHYVFTGASNSVIFYRSDSTNPNPASPPSSSGRLGTPNQIQLMFPTTAPPNAVTTPNPANEAQDVYSSPTLSWVDGGGGATGYKVFFGTTLPETPNATVSTPSWSPGALDYRETYLWKVVPFNANGDCETGVQTWSFTVMSDPTIVDYPYVQSFEDALYPPLGWYHTLVSGTSGITRTTTGTSSPTVSAAFDGSAMLHYNSNGMTSGSNAWLATPPIDMRDSESNYRVRFAMWRSSTGYPTTADKFEVYANTTQDLSGTPVLLGTVHRSKSLTPVETGADGWYEYSFDIGLGDSTPRFVIFKAISAYGNSMNIDKVSIFTESAAMPPSAPVSLNPANNATGVAISTNFTWTNGGGIPEGYQVFMGTDPEALERVADVSTNLFDPEENLLFGTTYYWYVQAYNNEGSADSATLSFSTASGLAITPAPANLATAQDATNRSLDWADVAGATGYKIKVGTSSGASDIVNMASVSVSQYTHNANWPWSTQLFWTVYTMNGSQEVAGTEWSFTTGVNPTLTAPVAQDFSTFPPTNWTRWSGLLEAPSTLTSTTIGWVSDGFANVGSSGSAKINIYGTTYRYWLITPPIDLGEAKASYNLEFDLALTDFGATTIAELTGTDDKFAVLISTDGTTWTSANTLRLWDNAGSAYVYNNISTSGERVSIDLAGYSGIIKIAFYGESTLSNADNDLFVDNFEISSASAPPSAPTVASPVNNATNVAINTNLAWSGAGGAPTGYQVFVGNDAENMERVADLENSPYTIGENWAYGTQYFWRVDAYNANGTTTGTVWNFTTTSGIAQSPSPANNTTNLSPAAKTLDWADVAGATGYKIAVGTTPGGTDIANMVACATSDWTKASNWAYGTQYYWTVYTMNGAQQVTGTEWTFTTGADPTINTLPHYVTLTGTTGSALPYGWNQQWSSAYTAGLWTVSSTNSAGGSSPEFRHGYGANQTTAQWTRLIAPPVNVSGMNSITTKWRHSLDWDQVYNEVPLTMNFQYSLNGVDWTTLWTLEVETDVLAEEKSFTLPLSGASTISFAWYVVGNPYDMNNWNMDNFKVLLDNTEVTQGSASGGNVNVTVPAVTNTVTSEPVTPQVTISGLANSSALVTVGVGFASANVAGVQNAGLNLLLTGTSFAGSTVTVTHNLGFIPEWVKYQIGNGSLINVPADASWTETALSITVDASKGPDDLQIIFPKSNDDPLPVSLSSFSAVLTADMYVKIAWTAESEVNHAGYNVLRAAVKDLNSAIYVNSGLISDGSALGTQISYSYTDNDTESNTVYYYWLESVSLEGVSEFFGPLSVTVGDGTTGPTTPDIPVFTALLNAYPNPFNPNTNLRYSLKEAGSVRMDIYNAKGQLVRSMNASHATPGYFSMNWDGRDASGKTVGSGVYMYRMTSGQYTAAKKMILAK
jgi:hypothetical protein